jgi:hypothetical protein
MANASDDPQHFLKVAENHVERVGAAWDPPDWSDLGTYGLYCLEALIRAAALKAGDIPARTHWDKVKQAKTLTIRFKLPDIAELLQNLNDIRKAYAYGDSDVDETEYDAEDMADEIEDYFRKVTEFCR